MSMDHGEMVGVIQAHIRGETVQFKLKHGITGFAPSDKWVDLDYREHPFNFSSAYYRIKPTPLKPREWWIGFCAEHEKIFGERPIPQCPHCDIIHVREVLSE